jgi:hypothetical protein
VETRTRLTSDSDVRLKSGGKSVYVMSGLLICAHCNRNFIMDSATHYRCGGWLDGKMCNNSTRVRLDRAKEKVLG